MNFVRKSLILLCILSTGLEAKDQYLIRQRLSTGRNPSIRAPSLNLLYKRMKENNIKPQREVPAVGGVVIEISDAELKALENVWKQDGIEVEKIQTYRIPRPTASENPPRIQVRSQFTPWGVRRVRANQVFDSKGAGIKVCVNDSGIDLDHPDLAANILRDANGAVVGFNAIDPAMTPEEQDFEEGVCVGHGTHVAGTIAALDNSLGVVGVAPEASLIPSKGFTAFIDENGDLFCGADTIDIINSLQFCINVGADVINMSWGGGGESQAIHDVLTDAYNQGIILVAAAGNEAGPVGFPAAHSEVVAVSATDINDRIASFSNTGPEVELSAPGASILSTVVGGYATYSGTSMATPHVAGVAALMLSRNGSLKNFNQVLGNSGRFLAGLSVGLPPQIQGSRGLVDALNSLSR